MIFLALKRSAVAFILLINVKMSTIVGILAFMSRKTFILSSVEHEKSFITWSDGEEDDSSQTKSSFWQAGQRHQRYLQTRRHLRRYMQFGGGA